MRSGTSALGPPLCPDFSGPTINVVFRNVFGRRGRAQFGLHRLHIRQTQLVDSKAPVLPADKRKDVAGANREALADISRGFDLTFGGDPCRVQDISPT